MIPLLTSALALVAFGCLLAAPGVLALRILAGSPARSGLEGLATVCLGLAAWMLALFVLCAIGQWHALSFSLLAAAGIGSALWLRPRARSSLSDDAPTEWAQLPLVVAIGLVLAGAFAIGASPEVSWDAGAYHLTLPRLYLAAHGFRDVPFNVYSDWPHAIELLYGAALLVSDQSLAKGVHFAFGAATLWAVAIACRDARRPAAAATVAAALLVGSPVFVFELQVAYVELAQAFFTLAALLFLERSHRDDDPRLGLTLAGVCCGVLMSIKLSGVVGAAAVAAIQLPRLRRAARAGRLRTEGTWFCTRFALPALLLAGPWFVKTLWLTGNPVYPFLYSLWGGADWSPALSEQFGAWHAQIGMGRDPVDYLLLPFRVIWYAGPSYSEFGDVIGRHWLVALALAPFGAWRLPRVRPYLAVCALVFVGWALSSQQSRFLLPILPVLAVATALTLDDLAAKLGRSARETAMLATLTLASIALLASSRDTLLDGLRRTLLYQEQSDLVERSAVHPVYDFIDTELPTDARLLFLATNQGFFSTREYLADSFFEASQIVDWLKDAPDARAVAERLRARNLTHVLWHDREWGLHYPESLTQLLADSSRCERVYRSPDGHYEIFALRSPPDGSP